MVYKVIWAILLLLSEEVPLEELLTKDTICKMKPIADATLYNVVYPSHWYDSEMLQTLIAVAHVESRFTYNQEPGEILISPKGACGLFQAIPKFTDYKCKDFLHPLRAGMVAVDHIEYIQDRWGKDDIHLCHYNSGNRCNRESRKYAKDIIKAKDTIKPIFTEENYFTLETIFISLIYSQCPKGEKIDDWVKFFNP